jgi:hypothetical protein
MSASRQYALQTCRSAIGQLRRPAPRIELTTQKRTLRREDGVTLLFEGFLNLSVGGTYSFSLAPEDGCKRHIDG